MSILKQRAVISALSISVYDGSRQQRDGARETAEAHGAATEKVKLRTQLIPRDYLRDIVSARSALIAAHEKSTLLIDGVRYLPTVRVVDDTRKIAALIRSFDHEADCLANNYKLCVGKWLLELGDFGARHTYPAPDEIRDRYTASHTIKPVGDVDNWLTGVASAERDELIARAQRDERETIAASTRQCWERLAAAVSRVSDRLGAIDRDGAGRLYDTVITDVRELCDLLPALDIAADPILATTLAEARAHLASQSVDQLRVSKGARAATKSAADAILAKMQGYGIK